MSTLRIKLLEISHNLIKEIGDLKNVNPYSFSKKSQFMYGFKMEDKYNGKINFTRATPIHLEHIEFPPAAEVEKSDAVYNVGYNIEGSDTQFIKTNPAILFKVLKTVIECIKDFIKSNPNSTYIIFEVPKNTEEKNVYQKFYLYSALAAQNLPSGYTSGHIKVDNGTEGLYISPIYKRNN